MELGFDTNVGDMVILVIDSKHPRYGQIGKMLHHDWKEYGGIGVEFSDGRKEEFYDGIIKGDSPSKIKRFYRHIDRMGEQCDSQNAGPLSFQREFTKHGGNLENLAEQYKRCFNEELPQTLNPS